MAIKNTPESVVKLIRLMHENFRKSEIDIANTLADEDGPMTMDELADATGYTKRTVKKRMGTLEERLHGEPFVKWTDNNEPYLHSEFAAAIRAYNEDAA